VNEADAEIREIFLNNPNYAPNPAMFPQEVIDRFNLVRGKMAAELKVLIDKQTREAEQRRLALQKLREDEDKWIGDLEKLASQERVVQTNSRWIALIPFGIGQFQNGDVPGGIGFAVSEVLTAGTSLTIFALAANLSSLAPAPNQINATNARLNAFAILNRISFSLWGALTLGGILHAQLTFVPERVTIRSHPIPPRPKLVPMAAPLQRGAVLGLAGTF
jgi:hypothetical protein